MRVLRAALAVAAGGTPAAAQVAPNRTTAYLFQTDVRDARAVWVNPAATAIRRPASIHADLVVADPSGDGRVGQVTAGFSSRGLSFAYQYDRFDGARGHTYRIGLAGSRGGLALGGAVAVYHGGADDVGYDVGAVYRAAPSLTLGATVANIGRPTVRGVAHDVAVIPGATVTPLGPALELSALGRFGGPNDGSAVGVRWRPPLRLAGALTARVDLDGDFRSTAFSFGLAIGALDQLGLVATTPRDVSTLTAASMYGVASRPSEP